ncbi:MAG: SPOR domain-containing protein [Proteobacteria bacterium]|nr:SPOR domain-containing protein [Pseudomonadota bacterium]
MVFTQRPGKGSQNQSNGNKPQNEPYMNTSPSRAMTGPIHPQQHHDPYFQNQQFNPQNPQGGYNPYYDPRMSPYGGQTPPPPPPYGQSPYPQTPYGAHTQQHMYPQHPQQAPQQQSRGTRPEDLKGLSFWRDEDENGYYDNAEEDVEKSSPLKFILAIAGLVIVTCMLWLGYRFATQSESEMIPLIPAEAGPYKRRPENPGGMAFPHQEMLVYGRLSPQQQNGQPVERVMPEQEQYFVPQGQEMVQNNGQDCQTQNVPSSFENPGQQPIQQQSPVPMQQQPLTNQNQHQQMISPPQQQPVVQQQAALPQQQQTQTTQQHAPVQKTENTQPKPEQIKDQMQTVSTQKNMDETKTNKKVEDAPKSQKVEDKKSEDVKSIKTTAKNPVTDVIKKTLEPGYYMQLASLRTESSARDELTRLRSKFKDMSPVVQPFKAGVKNIYRVMVGPFSERDIALKKCITVGNGCKVIHIEQNN